MVGGGDGEDRAVKGVETIGESISIGDKLRRELSFAQESEVMDGAFGAVSNLSLVIVLDFSPDDVR